MFYSTVYLAGNETTVNATVSKVQYNLAVIQVTGYCNCSLAKNFAFRPDKVSYKFLFYMFISYLNYNFNYFLFSVQN